MSLARDWVNSHSIMRSIMTRLHLIASVTALLIIAIEPAYAYLDPGTGSMLLQGLIAGVAAGLMVIKLYWYKIKAFLFRRGHKAKPQSDSPVDNVTKEDDAR